MGNGWYRDFVNPSNAFKKAMHGKNDLFWENIKYASEIINARLSLFTYEDLDKVEGLTPDILEMALLFYTNLCFYKSPGLDTYILCIYENSGNLNYYSRPEKVNLRTFNGINIADNVPYKDIILVKDNKMDIPPIFSIANYIYRIVDLDKVTDNLLNIIGLPLVFSGPKTLATEFKTIATRIGIKNPFIIGSKDLLNSVQTFGIDVPISPDVIYDLKIKYKNECLQSLGIYGKDLKRERLISDEVKTDNDYVDKIYEGLVQSRKRFISELNKKSGLNIKFIEVDPIEYEIDNEEKEENKNV